MKTIFSLFIFLLLSLQTSVVLAQFASLYDDPRFKNNKVNVFQDTATQAVYSLKTIDSLYRSGTAPFALFNFKDKPDSIYWQIRFITSLPTIKPKWIGKSFPLTDFTDYKGNAIHANSLKGKILVVNCWSIHCGPCVKEIPYLNKVIDSLGQKNIVYLGICYDKPDELTKFFSSAKARAYMNAPSTMFNFQIVASQISFLDKTLGVLSYPTTFVVDREGIVRYVMEGVNLDTSRNLKTYEELHKAIKELL